MAASAAAVAGPEIRTTATALRPGGVASAKMVSLTCVRVVPPAAAVISFWNWSCACRPNAVQVFISSSGCSMAMLASIRLVISVDQMRVQRLDIGQAQEGARLFRRAVDLDLDIHRRPSPVLDRGFEEHGPLNLI